MNNKLILLLFILFIGKYTIHAQGVNQMQAMIEFEDAEKAFSEEKYDQTIIHLNKAETLLGSWKPKIGYLKIIALDKITAYEDYSNQKIEQLSSEVTKYMNYADSHSQDVDLQKIREVTDIEKKVILSQKTLKWSQNKECISGNAALNAKNYEEALNWFKKAVENDNPWAMNEIGNMYKNGLGVSKDYNEAMNWYRKAVGKGDANAMFNIGALYQGGSGVSKDVNEAMNWHVKAADKGLTIAMNFIGFLYEDGLGVNQDYNEALKWYKEAANRENMYAMNNIAVLYYFGRGVSQDYKEAMRWWKKAADRGHIQSMNRIGALYYSGYGVSQDYNEAMNWYRKAADKGYPNAMTNIAFMYYDGKGVAKDNGQAVLWYEKALNVKNFIFSKDNAYYFASAYFNSFNYPKALEWFKKAFELGINVAKYDIAKIYREGLGITKDKRLAKEWEKK